MIVKEWTASTDTPLSDKDFGRKKETSKNAGMMKLKIIMQS